MQDDFILYLLYVFGFGLLKYSVTEVEEKLYDSDKR